MKVLLAPLNWGLGHATRCIPLIRQYMAQGHEVVLGGDGESLLLLRKTFPQLRVIDLPSLELRYTDNAKQRGFYLRAIPALIRFTICEKPLPEKVKFLQDITVISKDSIWKNRKIKN